MSPSISIRLNEACRDTNPFLSLEKVGGIIIDEYNREQRLGSTALPLLNFIRAEFDDRIVTLLVSTKSNMAMLHDLVAIKACLLADSLEVSGIPQFAIGLTYNRF